MNGYWLIFWLILIILMSIILGLWIGGKWKERNTAPYIKILRYIGIVIGTFLVSFIGAQIGGFLSASIRSIESDTPKSSMEKVDLGLSVKWATCNVGAATPEDYGNYYAWGETTTKTSYDESNSVTDGQQISDFSGNATYDAARANWGSTWRMPTKAEMEELLNNCTWTWTTQNGVNGYEVTGPNGNSIFLPAAGRCCGVSRIDVGEGGYYWSSTPSRYTYAAFDLFHPGNHDGYWSSRYEGHTVRPVSE